ncbi:Putative TrmH family tRNA/rRNA methyltransferase [Rhizobiaceae bacterium]|nr:Putative TrmH family tRNA/rRNA methyltransferase [Rhizobiaceae bacterium]
MDSEQPAARLNAIRIDDPGDPRVAVYRDVRERDLVGREGRFVAEGKVVLAALFSAGRFEAESVLVLENRLEGLADTLDAAPADLPVYVASAEVMNAIAGFPIHRGILAVGRRRAPETFEDLLASLPRRATVVVLVGLSNHDNVGAIFRNAAAFGADAVVLDRTSCDPLYRKAIRVSVGAALKVPFVRGGDAVEIIGTVRRHGFEPVALSPAGAEDIRSIARPERAALVLGAEGPGLSAALLGKLRTARIAMAPGFDSLNVAAASAIALHEMCRAG